MAYHFHSSYERSIASSPRNPRLRPASRVGLDAWAGLRADVPDTLLRRMAFARSPTELVFHVFTNSRHAACAALLVLSRSISGNDGEQSSCQRGHKLRGQDHHSSRSRDLGPGHAVSPAGIFHRLALGAVD